MLDKAMKNEENIAELKQNTGTLNENLIRMNNNVTLLMEKQTDELKSITQVTELLSRHAPKSQPIVLLKNLFFSVF